MVQLQVLQQQVLIILIHDSLTYPAVQWDWDDVSDGDDTPALTCEEQWGACLVSLADYDYYNGTTWATECAEFWC